MTFTDPFEVTVPSGTRPIGEGPFWTPGTALNWTFRRFDFDRDPVEVVRPMQVIEDSPAGALLWMPGGTPTAEARIIGWEDTDPHDVPHEVRFRPLAEAPRRVAVPGTWRGLGVLKIVPPDVPFSVWVLLKPGEGEQVRADWYINLEATHRRTDDTLFTSDHILDIIFPYGAAPNGAAPLRAADGRLDPSGAKFKDEDELASAAENGAWPRAWSETIRGNGTELLDRLGEFTWAFDPKWEDLARRLASGETAKTGRLGPAGQPDSDSSHTQEHSQPKQEHRRVSDGCYGKDWI